MIYYGVPYSIVNTIVEIEKLTFQGGPIYSPRRKKLKGYQKVRK